MIASRPGSGRPPPGPDRVVMVPPSLGRICPHHFDKTAHRNVRSARRLTFRGVALSYCSDEYTIQRARRLTGGAVRVDASCRTLQRQSDATCTGFDVTRRKVKPMSDFQAIADRVEIEALRGELTDAAMMRDYDRAASLFTPDGAVRMPHVPAELAGRPGGDPRLGRAVAGSRGFPRADHPPGHDLAGGRH